MGTIPQMNILIYHQKHLTNNINDAAKTVNEKHFKAIIRSIRFMSRLFPASRIFFVNDQCHQFSKDLSDNVTLIDLNKINNPSFKLVRTALQTQSLSPNFQTPDRHFNFLKNYFHFYEKAPMPLILSFFERWFYIYNILTSHGIENFVGLDSDCILLEDMSSHNYKKIGINHPPNLEDCWPNSLICSTANLNKFLDFVCSFYEGVQQHITEAKQKPKSTPSPRSPMEESAGIKYINSFFDKPRTGLCDMALWYLFKKQNPDLFINNLTIDHDRSVHDWGLGYDTATFTSQSTQQHNPQGIVETVDIKQIFYTEDGPCFKKRDTKELIKIISLHFSPGTLKFDMIPFIDEYEKIYS